VRQAANGKVLFTLAAALFEQLQWRAVRSRMRTQPLLDELEAALASGTDARRVEMLTRIADLFINGMPNYSEDQIALFDDLMGRLLNAIDANARTKLAQQLAPIANAPRNVIHTLAFDNDIDVARPVLGQSERISDAEILANATSKGQQHLLAIAQRKVLSEALTDILVERGDRNVVHVLVKNPGARFSDAGLHMLVRRATGDQTLTAEMGRRGDIRQRLAEKAANAERARSAAGNQPADVAAQELAVQVANARANERKASLDFVAARAEVEQQNRIRPIGDSEIFQYARDRKFAETAAGLSILCDTPFEVVERALLDPGAELVLILAKVAGLSSATARVILVLRAADRGIPASGIDQALENFEQLRPEVAQRVLSFFRTRAKKPADPEVTPAVAASG
jgi:uncharacterized protein (DUF2336 family)